MCENSETVSSQLFSEIGPPGEVNLVEDLDLWEEGIESLHARRSGGRETALGLGFSFCLHAVLPLLAMLLGFLFTPPSMPVPPFVTVSLVSMPGGGGAASNRSGANGSQKKSLPSPVPAVDNTSKKPEAVPDVRREHVARAEGLPRHRSPAAVRRRQRAVRLRGPDVAHIRKRPPHRQAVPTRLPQSQKSLCNASAPGGSDGKSGSHGAGAPGSSCVLPPAGGSGGQAVGRRAVGSRMGQGPGRGVEAGGSGLARVDRPPVPVKKVEPEFPDEARQMGISGRVLLKLQVKANGRVARVTVLESRPKGVFDRSAIEAVYKWRFKPGMYRGKAVATWVEMPVRFRLVR